MKTAVVYWSGTGNTEAMARAVAEGMTAAGAEAVPVSYTHLPSDGIPRQDTILTCRRW